MTAANNLALKSFKERYDRIQTNRLPKTLVRDFDTVRAKRVLLRNRYPDVNPNEKLSSDFASLIRAGSPTSPYVKVPFE